MEKSSAEIAKIQIIEYLDACLEAQPEWIKDLFHIQKASFVLTPDTVMVSFRKSVKKDIRAKVTESIAEYLTLNPCQSFESEGLPAIH